MPESATPWPAILGRSSPRILVVDDEPSICTIVRKTLTRDHYNVQTTTRSLEALQRLTRERFDLLITDISMPDLDGLELAEHARAAQSLLGIVIMTGYGSFENMSRALRTGVADFIIKPFDIEELRVIVARALERQRLQQDNVRLQTLLNVIGYGQTLNSTLDPQELLTIVADLVLRETAATALRIWTLDRQLTLRRALDRDLPDALAPVAESLAVEAHATHARAPLQHSLDLGNAAHTGAQLVSVPLATPDDWLGVIVAWYSSTPPPLVSELLGIIAQQTALALCNARQYTSLRELDRLKSEFIGIASHELRTPLSLVLGYSSLLRTRLDGNDREALQRVIDGALRIGDIIDDLVNLRRSETHQLTLDLTRLDIWDVLREVVSQLHALAESRQIMLHCTCPDAPEMVDADREKLTLALAHLVDNALKFSSAGTVVAVVGHAPTPEQPDVVIQISDDGIGIPQRDLDRIFERFYQVAPSTTRTQNGLGLGLTLAKVCVELHGGRIRVQSSSGQGSVFEVRLPVTPPLTLTQ